MSTEKKKVSLLVAKWWNPLFWAVVVLAPALGIVSGIVMGALSGMLMGYEKGLEIAEKKMHRINEQLP